MYKSLLAIVLLTSTFDGSRSQLQKDLDRSDAADVLTTLLFSNLPIVPVSSKVPARRSVLRAQNRLFELIQQGNISIPHSIKMRAAKKARAAADAVPKGKSFMQNATTIGAILSGLSDVADLPLFEVRPVKKVGMILITADHNFCGGYNSRVIKKAEKRIKELKDMGIEVQLTTIGQIGTKYFGSKGVDIKHSYEGGDAPTEKQSEEIMEEVIDSFLDGEVDRVELVYSNFLSMVKFSPSIRTLIPFTVSKDGIEMEDDEIKFTSKDSSLVDEKLREGAQENAEAFGKRSLSWALRNAWKHAVAAELTAVFTAATSYAHYDADELEKYPSLKLMRGRQVEILQALSEIPAGVIA